MVNNKKCIIFIAKTAWEIGYCFLIKGSTGH